MMMIIVLFWKTDLEREAPAGVSWERGVLGGDFAPRSLRALWNTKKRAEINRSVKMPKLRAFGSFAVGPPSSGILNPKS
jgi:hypothetical protein